MGKKASCRAWVTPKAWVSSFPWSIVAPLGVFLLTLAAFLPAVMSDYVYWDDDDLLLTNTIYRSINKDSLRWMFTTSYAGHFEPLTWLSYWLDWQIWKKEVSGYHLTSVLIHGGMALTFYFLVKRLLVLRRAWFADDLVSEPEKSPVTVALASAFAALLFAIHPLRVESVAWLAERRDVLSGFFFVAAILCYVRWRRPESGRATTRGWYWLAVLCQLLSLLAKASAVSLPLVLLILDVYPVGRLHGLPWRRRFFALVWDKAPFFVLSVAAGVRAWVAQVEAGAMYPLAEYDLASRMAQMLYGFSFYAWKTLFPTNLGPLYPIPHREVLLGWVLWKGLIGSAILLALAIALRRRCPIVMAAIAAYCVMILPVSGVFQSGPQLVADRYSYLSCLGFAMLPAAGILQLARSSWWGRRNAASVSALACAGLTTGLFFATTNQSLIWSTALDLWQHAVTVSPESSFVHTNLADAYMSLPNYREAIDHYRRALEIEPRDAVAAHHFGHALSILGKDRTAEKLFLHSLAIDPGRTGALISLAQLWIARGQEYEAIILLRDRIQRAPYDLKAMAFLAEVLATHPDPDVRDGCEAAELAEKVSIAKKHRDANILLIWSSALAEDGEWKEALRLARAGKALADKQRMMNLSGEFSYRMQLFEQQMPFHLGN